MKSPFAPVVLSILVCVSAFGELPPIGSPPPKSPALSPVPSPSATPKPSPSATPKPTASVTPSPTPSVPASPSATPTPVCSYWHRPYNIYGNHCHHAANCGVASGATGVFSCKKGVTSGYTDHTVNYTSTPCANGKADCYDVCLTEPQVYRGWPGSAGGDVSDQVGNTQKHCCWTQSSAEPKTAAGKAGSACYRKVCGSQSTDLGGTPLAPGTYWPVGPDDTLHPANCAYKHMGESRTTCKSCCDTSGAAWDHYVNESGLTATERASRRTQKTEFLAKCKSHCSLDLKPLPTPLPTPRRDGDGNCDGERAAYESCMQKVLTTPRNESFNHYCYTDCSARFGMPHCNQVDQVCSPIPIDYGGAYQCMLTLTGLPLPPPEASFPYMQCFDKCMSDSASRQCQNLRKALDQCGDPYRSKEACLEKLPPEICDQWFPAN